MIQNVDKHIPHTLTMGWLLHNVWEQLDEGTEWILPKLREVDFSALTKRQIKLKTLSPISTKIRNKSDFRHISIEWGEKRPISFSRGILLSIGQEDSMCIDARDCVTKLRIAAPSAKKLHLKGCGLLIECPLLIIDYWLFGCWKFPPLSQEVGEGRFKMLSLIKRF